MTLPHRSNVDTGCHETDLRHQIHADAIEDGHDPGPWIETTKNGPPHRYYSACVRCGEEAVIVAGECEVDNMQGPCGVEDLYREVAS